MLDRDGDFDVRCNKNMYELESLNDPEEIAEVKAMITRHVEYTKSSFAQDILANWDQMLPKFVKIIPTAYKHILQTFSDVQKEGLEGDAAWLEAYRRDIAIEAKV